MDFTFKCFNADHFTGFLDNYESLIWTMRSDDLGECEIVIALNNVDFNIIDQGFIVVNNNPSTYVRVGNDLYSEDTIIPDTFFEACFITSKKISLIDGTVTFKGKSIDFGLTSRVVAFDVSNLTAAGQTINTALINMYAELEGYTEQRDLPFYATTSWPKLNFTLPKDVNVTYKTGFEAFRTICEMVSSGVNLDGVASCFYLLDLRFNVTEFSRDYAFCLQTLPIAIDRTVRRMIYNYEVKPVIFSTDFDNVFNLEVEKDNEDLKNVALVAGEGEGAQRTRVWSPQLEIGKPLLERREMFVDARDLKSEDYGSQSAYLEALRQRGIAKLIAQVDSYAFEIPQNSPYTYREDFYLGDYVLARMPEFDVELSVKVSESIETFSRDGYNCDLTFGTMKETLSQRLNKKFGN